MKGKKRFFRWLIFTAALLVILILTKPSESDFKHFVNQKHTHTMGTLYKEKNFLFFGYYTEIHHMGDEPDAAELYFLGIFGNFIPMGEYGFATE